MAVTTLPQAADLQSKPDSYKIDVLDALFEPSPAIHKALVPVTAARQWNSWPELIDACQIELESLAKSTSDSSTGPALLAILGSHPRLGEKKIDSAQSAAEQANLQKNSNTAQEEELANLNRQYEETFPGLRYVVFVNGRGRPEIMANMRERIARGDFKKEVHEALEAMCAIAKDRASKLQSAKSAL